MTKRVLILGCGPAGLMAAHAAALSGWDYAIYSKRKKSDLFGAQYLHAPIPNLDCGEPKLVAYRLNGTPAQYRQKVYGPTWDGTVSPEDLAESHDAWDLRTAYHDLWQTHGSEIRPWDLVHPFAATFKIAEQFDVVISTVPRKIWAERGDVFESTKVWVMGDATWQKVPTELRPEPFTVVCSGFADQPWYRISNIYGHCTVEWPWLENYPNKPHQDAAILEKPLRHNSQTAKDFVHLGRFGAWQKGILTSDVFVQAMKVFADDHI